MLSFDGKEIQVIRRSQCAKLLREVESLELPLGEGLIRAHARGFVLGRRFEGMREEKEKETALLLAVQERRLSEASELIEQIVKLFKVFAPQEYEGKWRKRACDWLGREP